MEEDKHQSTSLFKIRQVSGGRKPYGKGEEHQPIGSWKACWKACKSAVTVTVQLQFWALPNWQTNVSAGRKALNFLSPYTLCNKTAKGWAPAKWGNKASKKKDKGALGAIPELTEKQVSAHQLCSSLESSRPRWWWFQNGTDSQCLPVHYWEGW